MRHLDLFSGIGGFALAARWMGWETIQFVEIDKFCQKVLTKNSPNVPIHGDIKTFDGSILRGTVDILTGGFPCQPFSTAGQRKGKEDDRYLWPEMLRIIHEIKPTWIVGENVAGIESMALNEVLSSLEGEGYNTETYIIPACALNAPHRRDRFWIVAHSCSNGQQWNQTNKEGFEHNGRRPTFCEPQPYVSFRTFTYTNGERLQGYDKLPGQKWENFPTQSPIRSGDDGIPSGLVRSAVHGAGNAIVPQVAFEIFKAIERVI